MPTTIAQIQSHYAAIDFLLPSQLDAATVQSYEALTPAAVATAIENEPYALNVVDPVSREYKAAFDRFPDQAGEAYAINQPGSGAVSIGQFSTAFASSAEFDTRFNANAATPANATLVTAFYENVLQRAPDAAGLAYWEHPV
jgi:hypothetical protein